MLLLPNWLAGASGLIGVALLFVFRALLNYGVIDSDGYVNVRIIYDHRVMDGAIVARALARLEQILNTSILDEIRSLAKNAPSANPLPALGQMQT
jgi:hypothetical protein